MSCYGDSIRLCRHKMTEYTISFFGLRHTLLLLSATDAPICPDRERGLLIIPDSRAGEDVTAVSFGREKYTVWEGKMLLSFFFREIMGYPHCELSVRMDDAVFEVRIFDTPRHFATFSVEECKLLSTFDYTAPDLTEHTLYTVLCDCVYRVVHAHGDAVFRSEILPTIRVVRGLPTAHSALAVYNGAILLPHGERLTPYHVISAAISLLGGTDGQVGVSCGDLTLSVVLTGGSATLFAPVSHTNSNKM